MEYYSRNNSGFISLGVIFLVFALITTVAVTQTKNLFPLAPGPIPTETPSPSPSQLQTPSPTPTTQPVTPSSTPKPTLQPVSGLPAQAGPPGSGYSRITVATERGNFTISVISIDTTSTRMITDTASDSDCPNSCPILPLSNYIARNGGFAGMNGTYFCPTDYGECAGKLNSFDFPVYNSRLGKWINGGNLFWNNRSMIYFDGSGPHFVRNANSFVGGPAAGIVNHPGLVEAGNVIADQFPLTDKQQAKGTKTGIGIRGRVMYMVVANNVDILDFAHVFKSLGAENALNLDGGGSVALWFGGYKAGPGRNLPNAIIFTR
ncbi:phosphodiester glycosidase family protein [Candidatus Microgenomates bacterium]|nr:phosphodiester glycosidase family protein [Candidatus Microgenomates bacterium]